MKRHALVALGLLALCGGLYMPFAAHAATKSASISVSVEVVDSCSIVVSGNAAAGAARCARATPYRVVTTSSTADANPISDTRDETTSVSGAGTSQNGTPGVTLMTFVF